MKYDLTESQIDKMKHSIGFREDRIRGRKYRKYEAFRNHYSTREGCDEFEELEDLADKGLMICRQDGTQGYLFHVSAEGIRYLSQITGVKITETD